MVDVVNLERLYQNAAIVVPTTGHPTINFVQIWQKFAGNIEEQFAAILLLIAEIVIIDGDITALTLQVNTNTTDIGTNTTNIGTNTTNIGTNTTDIGTNTTNIGTNTTNIGTNATDIGTNATDIATTLALIRRTGSWPRGLLLQANDAGANVTVAVSAHTRAYADATTLAIAAGNITGLAYSTTYGLYYDDTTLTNGSPTFLASTTVGDTVSPAAAGRHHLGVITTPAPLGASLGKNSRPPGADLDTLYT